MTTGKTIALTRWTFVSRVMLTENDLSLFPRQTIQYRGNPSLSPNTKAEEAEVEWFCDYLQDLLELTPKIDVLFIIKGDWNAKIGSQEISEVTGKFGLAVQNEAGQKLRKFCQGNTLVIANTLFQQHKRRLYTWTSSDGQHRNQIDYIFCTEDGRVLYSQKKTNKQKNMTVAHIMNSLLQNSDLKKVWKTSRPFRYDLNQILYDYTMEVTNGFKGLDQ